jgi:NadR type nicotinamide-nucleotide adenylyltransferase
MEEALKQHASDCLKIVLFGPESSGKTTLAKQLAAHYSTTWVAEYMREYLQKKWDTKKEVCTKDDLLPIAIGQMASENASAKKANRILFCDTNLYELKVYSQYYYNGFCPEEVILALKKNSYTLYFLTNIDIPWQEDDLRDRPYDRSSLFRIFENELKTNNLPYIKLSGNKNERLKTATARIDTLLTK